LASSARLLCVSLRIPPQFGARATTLGQHASKNKSSKAAGAGCFALLEGERRGFYLMMADRPIDPGPVQLLRVSLR
jgi:hypothetical protein